MELRYLLPVVGSVALLLACPARATVYCVNSASAITAAFNSANAAANGTVQDIRVRSGNYSLTGNLSFSNGADKEFSLSGGWNSDCSARTISAANTTLNGTGQSSSGTQFAFTGNHRSFRIEGIRFQNFDNFFLFESVCPFGQSCADTESVRVRYNHFRAGLSALIVVNDAQTYSVSNNLFENMIGSADSSILATVNLSYANEDALPQVSFNTFSLGCNGSKPGLRLHSEKSASLFSHNILASSGCSDPLRVISSENGKAWVFRNNLYPAVNSGPAPAAGSGGNLIGVNPQFVSGSDFHLRETAPASPAINAGQTPVQANLGGLAVPAQDLDGPAGARLVGSKYDMGAYESSINDASVITVTSTNDSGAGSLRSAITSANATPGLQKIQFNIPGGCSSLPHLIQLQTPLPDITDSVEIDGYSEPETSPNTLSLGSDAVLCIVILAQSGTLAQALQVPDVAPAGTSLTVKGIAFAGSTGFNGNFSVALRLRGGSNHLIQGNAFAGVGPGAIGPLGQLNFGIQIRDSAQSATIGGAEPEHRNSFGAMASSAIVLNDASSGGHTIQNNYIGLSASGLVASPIQLNGIFASASPNVRILDNVISAVPNNAAISITGATATGYEIARNKLGTSASGIPTAAFRNSTGISIANGSGGHQIGGILNASVSNTITNSNGAGVHLTPTAGNGTTVRPNRIFGNGVDGVGLGIDLGALGPLANDGGDGDGGPNNGQNKPVINQSLVNPNGTRQVSGSLGTQSGSYIIDIYRSPDCPGGRGNMLNLIATEFVVNAANSVNFDVTVPAAGAPGILTAVATRVSNGDSSEVSSCFLEQHATTTTIVSDTPDPHQVGQSYEVVVQVASAGGVPTGNISVIGAAGEICEVPLSAAAGVAVASCQFPGNWFGSTDLVANYTGSVVFLPSSDSEPHAGIAANTTTTIISDDPDPSQVGQPYTVLVDVLRSHDGLAVNTGTISVSDGSGQSCQSAVSNGTASCQITSLSVGNKTLTATFSGSPGALLGSSDSESHGVVAASTTTTITSDVPDPSIVGQAYAVTVAVTSNPGAGTPIGSVTVSDGSGASCDITLAGGGGFCQLTSTSPGNKTLSASYAPASQSFGNSSDTEPHLVNPAGPAATTTLITVHTPNPSRVGEPYSVGISVTSDGGTPSGSFFVNASGGSPGCSGMLVNGSGSCELISSNAGETLLTACLQANASFAGSCDSEAHSVIKADTSFDTLDFTPEPIIVGEPVQASVVFAVVAPGAGTPSGTITLSASASEQCVISLPALSCQLTFDTPGDRTVSLSYSGDANFNPSAGQAPVVVVGDAIFANGFE